MMTFLENYEDVFFWLMIASIVGFAGSLIIIPWMIVQLPSDYFIHEKRKKHYVKNQPGLVKMAILVLKNIVGILFIVSGVIMLFIPGQGTLTIIMGIVLTDLPYKYKLEQWIIKKPKLLRFINTLRIKAKKSPLKI